MKMLISFLIMLNCLTQAQTNRYLEPDLSTPERAWESMLAALKTGKEVNVQAVVTPTGFQELISFISPYNDEEPFASTFITWGKNWENEEWQWLIENSTALLMSHSNKYLKFLFVKTENEWLFDKWLIP